MKMQMKFAVMVLLVFAAACASNTKPAEEAIAAAEAAVNAAKTEARMYIPEQVKALEDELAAAKDAFAKKDYTAALTAARELTAKAQSLGAAAEAKKTELTAAWEQMSGGLPQMVEALRSRVDILSQSKQLPAGLEKAKFEEIKAGLPEVTQMWEAAQAAFSGGNLPDAVSKANAVKTRTADMMTTLGMQVPAAAQI